MQMRTKRLFDEIYTNRVSSDTLGKIWLRISNYSINKSWMHENEKESCSGDNGLTSKMVPTKFSKMHKTSNTRSTFKLFPKFFTQISSPFIPFPDIAPAFQLLDDFIHQNANLFRSFFHQVFEVWLLILKI